MCGYREAKDQPTCALCRAKAFLENPPKAALQARKEAAAEALTRARREITAGAGTVVSTAAVDGILRRMAEEVRRGEQEEEGYKPTFLDIRKLGPPPLPKCDCHKTPDAECEICKPRKEGQGFPHAGHPYS
jgi:hypothetical protein